MPIPSYNRIGYDYLQSRSNIYNGGIIAEILVSLSSNISQKTSFTIGHYIDRFFFQNTAKVPFFNNSTISYERVSVSNLTTTVFGIIYVLISVISCLVLGIVWICYRVNRYHPTCQGYLHRIKNSFKSQPKNVIQFQFLSDLQIKKQRQTRHNRILILCILCYICLFMFLISFIFTATSEINLKTQLMGPDITSLTSSWQQSSQQLIKFLDLMLYESQAIFNKALNSISVSMKNLIFGSLNNLMDQILVRFGVGYIFTNSTKLIVNLEETSQSMTYIKDNSGTISKEINIQTGSLDANVEQLRFAIQQVCHQLVWKTECIKYFNDSALLKISINTSAINDHSSINFDFILTQFQLNLTELARKFETIEKTMKSQIAIQTRERVDQINIDQSIQTIRPLWDYIYNLISPWQTKISAINPTISESLKSYGDTFFIITAVILVVVFFLVVLYAISLTRLTILYYFERQILCQLITLPASKPISILNNYHKRHYIYIIRHRYKMGSLAVYSYIIIFGLVIVLVLILSLVIVNIAHLFYNEGCIQIWRPEGLTITDGVLDIFLTKHWSYLLSLIITKTLPMGLTFPRPKKPLTGILNNCTANIGILYAVQVTDVVNVSSLMWSPQNYKYLNDGLNLTYEAVVHTNIKSMIPSNMNSFINNAKNIGKYFDEINYQASIDELGKNLIILKNYSEWINSSIQYFTPLNRPESDYVVVLLNTLNTKVPELQRLERNIAKLRLNFQIIQDKRNNSYYIDGLLYSLNRLEIMLTDNPITYQEIKTLYTQIMLTEFPINAERNLTNIIADLLKHLFPCENLSLALSGLLNNLCTSDSTLVSICSFGLNMAVMCAFMIVMLHCLWMTVRKELSDGEEEGISKC